MKIAYALNHRGINKVNFDRIKYFCNINEFRSWKKIPYDLSLDMFAYYKSIAKKAHIYRIKVTQKNRIHGTSSWNKGFLSKFYLSILFIKRAIQIKLCHYF